MTTSTEKSNVYSGRYHSKEFHAFVNGMALSMEPSQSITNYSPAGFSWGTESAGAKQLALAILTNELEDNKLASDLCLMFMQQILARLTERGGQRPIEAFAITSKEIMFWSKKAEEELKSKPSQTTSKPQILDDKGRVITGRDLVENPGMAKGSLIQCPRCSGDVPADFSIMSDGSRIHATMICPKCKSIIEIP